MGKEKFKQQIKNFLTNLSKDFKIKKIILFGSRAKGNYKNESDFDLIIVSDDFEGINFLERVAKVYDYWDLDMPVDFLCYTSKEFNKISKMVTIVKEALKTGIIIK
ncbi:MAG: nucleotidyltransferase domain-containing protein [Candidatus Nanoarchaeia archaeon]